MQASTPTAHAPSLAPIRASGPIVMPDIDEKTRVEERQVTTDEGDHERFAHYVFGKNPGAMVTESMVTGTPIRALCGKLWVPSRDASRYPVCPDCKKAKDEILRRSGGGGSGDGGGSGS